MPIDDARVSEAHAMISLREQELRLIALRGAFAVNGRPTSEIALCAGMEILFARGLSVEVEEVHLPNSVLGLEGDGLPRTVLPSVASVQVSDGVRLITGFHESAAAWIWCTGETWRLSLAGSSPRTLSAGDSFKADNVLLHAVEVPLLDAGQAATHHRGGIDTPLSVVANFDTVHVHRQGEVVLVLGGVPARIISELVAMGGPTHWSVLAAQIWPREPDAEVVRSRLDVNMSRLRRKLREARVRTDLVHTDGSGQIELLLYPHDIVEDRT